MKRHAILYYTYVKLFLKGLVQYRLDFAIMILTTLLFEGARLSFIMLIFNKLPRIQGWTFFEILLIYGLLTIANSLNATFFNMPWGLQRYIQTGELDILLIRPISPLFQLNGHLSNNPTEVGRIAIGIIATILALNELHTQFQAWWPIYLPIVIINATILQYSILLILSSGSFWFTNVRSILYPANWLSEFGQFPVTIYALPIQFILIGILPYAMMGFFPVAFLLYPQQYKFYGIATTMIGFVFGGLALYIWSKAIKHYQSTGS